jgi:penicillin amidase
LSIPARELVPLLAKVQASRPSTETARRALTSWNFVLDTASVAAGIYEAWTRRLSANLQRVVVPDAARPFFRTLSTKRLIDWLTKPGAEFGPNPVVARDSLVLRSLDEAVDELTRRFGPAPESWKWGQPSYHHISITHALSAAVDSATRAKLNIGPAPRGGDALTVGATGGGDNQTSGASFRIDMDLSNWELTRGANNPGQSGDPASTHYRDLFALWSKDQFFAVPYARAAVDRSAESKQVLVPK